MVQLFPCNGSYSPHSWLFIYFSISEFVRVGSSELFLQQLSTHPMMTNLISYKGGDSLSFFFLFLFWEPTLRFCFKNDSFLSN
jgi:hypothetical protein